MFVHEKEEEEKGEKGGEDREKRAAFLFTLDAFMHARRAGVYNIYVHEYITYTNICVGADTRQESFNGVTRRRKRSAIMGTISANHCAILNRLSSANTIRYLSVFYSPIFSTCTRLLARLLFALACLWRNVVFVIFDGTRNDTNVRSASLSRKKFMILDKLSLVLQESFNPLKMQYCKVAILKKKKKKKKL